MQDVKPFWQRTEVIIAFILGTVLVMFALQNTAVVELRFGPFTFSSRRFVVIGGSFLIGFVVATLLCWARRWKKNT